MNWTLRKSMLSVAGLVFTGGAVAGPAMAAHAGALPAERFPTYLPRTGPDAADRDDQRDIRDRRDSGDDRDSRDDRDPRDGRRGRERTVGVEYQAQPNFYYCGPAATRIALSAAGKHISQHELARKLGTTVAGTDSAEDITRVLNELTGGGYRTTEIRESTASRAQIERLRADVVDALDAGDPVVANIKGSAVDTDGRTHSFPGGHYLAVVAYRDGGDLVRIADPAAPVGHYWMTIERLAHWIAERGYSS